MTTVDEISGVVKRLPKKDLARFRKGFAEYDAGVWDRQLAANTRFWRCYRALPAEVRALVDRNYALLKANPKHGLLHLQQIAALWSVRVGLHYGALATAVGDDLV